MTDFIIVGRGLAACVLAHTFHQENISFKIIGDENLSNCSKVAGGIWNPIVFKRLTKSWLANEIIPFLNEFYINCEKRVKQNLITQRDLIKPFTEDQEKKLWLNKALLDLSDYLDDTIHDGNSVDLTNCKIANQYGVVKQSGNLDVAKFLKTTTLLFKDKLISEIFDYPELKINPNDITYKTIKAKHIIFCEGYLVKNNPFFHWIPLKPAKGEIMDVAISDIKFKNKILNKNGFLMDVEEGIFKLGATYEWQNLTEEPTQKGFEELTNKLTQLINCNYAVLSHKAGIRPSSSDRRPIIGSHPKYNNLFIFNGLGTKGVMLAPYFAKKFVNFYLQKEKLPKEVNVERFYKQYVQ